MTGGQIALCLVLASALTHATWNAIGKLPLRRHFGAGGVDLTG